MLQICVNVPFCFWRHYQFVTLSFVICFYSEEIQIPYIWCKHYDVHKDYTVAEHWIMSYILSYCKHKISFYDPRPNINQNNQFAVNIWSHSLNYGDLCQMPRWNYSHWLCTPFFILLEKFKQPLFCHFFKPNTFS